MKFAAAIIMLAPWWFVPPTAPHGGGPVMQIPAPTCATCDVYNKAAKTADEIQRITSEVEAHIRRTP